MKSSPSAIVLKNFVPISNKVILFHRSLGKITCIYSPRDQAAQLCTGSLIVCAVESYKNWYRFLSVDILHSPAAVSVSKLSFLHDVTRLCLHMLPSKVPVYELFDFLWYIYQNFESLSEVGQHVALMRLFLLFDLLSEREAGMYQCALQNPYGDIKEAQEELQGYVRVCWNRFYQETSREK